VIGRQPPAGQIGGTLETMLEAQMAPKRLASEPALEADHVIRPNRLPYRHRWGHGLGMRIPVIVITDSSRR
jgi:hypothetical protein